MDEHEVTAPAMERLLAATAAMAAAEAAQAAAILELAHEVEWDEDASFDVVGTRPIRIGADGTRLVDEHLPLEVAAALGMSADSAIWLIRDIVNLAARHPRVWHAVQQGRLRLWQARKVTEATDLADLDRVESLKVDRLIAPAVGRVGWKRLRYLLRAAMLQVAPDKLRTRAEQSARSRYVRTGVIQDDPSSSYLAGRLDTADARGLDELLDSLADGLATAGEDGDHEQLRARALGLLADDLGAAIAVLERTEHPQEAPSEPATPGVLRRRRGRRPHQVFVHLTGVPVDADTIAEVEGYGPLLADQLIGILGDRPIRVTPVLTMNSPEPAVDSYDIPAAIRADVLARDRFEVFPSSSRRARSCDLDHTVPYVEGGLLQTRAGNLGPLGRRAHRAKTHGGWRVEQPRPGIFWWTSPRGQRYRVGRSGTSHLPEDDWLLRSFDRVRGRQLPPPRAA